MILQLVIGLAISLAVSLAAFIVLALIASRRHHGSLADMTRTLPATLGLLARLSRDSGVPRTVRWRIAFALAYNAQPIINIIPDFVPVIGFADNVVVTAWAVRSVIRVSGHDAVHRNWRGSPLGLASLYSALRLGIAPTS